MTSWWQSGIIYHIYPRSFQDTNGDGVGDLPGILRRLDYLQWLGVEAIWLSPIYPSPMADFGYDVSDYLDVDPHYGTLADVDALIAAVHARGLKIILDYVPNHTSSQHPWFIASRASRRSPKRDWYIWRDAAPGGGPPNNWLSRFDGESAWTWDEATGQYYLHTYLPEQPDLNWRNPEVREAMLDVMRFWLERGVDGFRVDVPHRVMKDPLFRDNPPNPNWRAHMDPSKRLLRIHNSNTPDSHLFNRWLRSVVDEYEDRVLIGELNVPLTELVKHYGDNDEFHLPFNFSLIFTPWQAEAVRALVDQYESLLPEGAWPNWVLGNHDQHRVASRVGAIQARVAMMLLLTLRGIPTLYYGDEIGMHDVDIPVHQVQDPWEKNVPGRGLGRDPERTPMQWNAGPNAGFCPPGVEPWLPVADDYQAVNVAVQCQQPDSMLWLTKKLIELRRAAPALSVGDYRACPTPTGLFAFIRQDQEERYLIVLNFTHKPRTWSLPAEVKGTGVVLSTYLDQPGAVAAGKLTLRADEGLVLRL